MKVKHLILSLAALWLGTACSKNEIDDGADNPATAQAGEVQLIIGGSGESVDYTKATTKGIASESENKIVDMTIYVFANEDPEANPVGSGSYYLQEVWTSAATADKANKKFTLQPSGSEWKASIFPDEWKTRPFLLFYCVANVGTTPPYDDEGTTAQPLVPVVLNPDHTGDKTDVDDETYVEIFYTAAQAVDDNIRTPLVMSGSGQTKIAGSVSKVKIELKRSVARFDIDNTSRSSNFIIESVTMKHARTTAPLVAGGYIEPILKANLETDPKLMTYNEVDFTKFDHANEGITESAIYVNPGLATDEPTLILKGQYISPTTGAPSAASYEVPIQRYNEVGKVNEYINIERNNRYKLRIIDVTSSTLKSTFEIEDWVNDGRIDTKPTDTKPIFVSFGPDNAPTDMEDPAKGILKNTTFRLHSAATFTMDVKSSSPVNATINTYRPDIASWVSLGAVTTAVNMTEDGYYKTTLEFTADYFTDTQYPVTVTLYNETSPNDPNTQTTLTFFTRGFPFASNLNPVVAFPATNEFDPPGLEINIAKQKGSYISFSVLAPQGVEEEIHDFEGLSFTRKEADAYTWIYTLHVTDPTKVQANPSFSFRNPGDLPNSGEEEITINAQTVVSTVATVGANAAIEDAGATIRLNVTAMKTSINSPVNATLNVPYGSKITVPTSSDWLTVSGGTIVNYDGTSTVKFSLKDSYTPKGGINNDFVDATIEIENAVSGATDQIIVKAADAKPIVAVGTEHSPVFTLRIRDDGNGLALGNPYEPKNGDFATFNVTCEGGMDIGSTADGLEVTSSDDIYTFTVTDATKIKYDNKVVFISRVFPSLTREVILEYLAVPIDR